MSWAVIFVCLLTSWAVVKSDSAITYDQQQIAQWVQDSGKIVDKKLAWVADTYAERKIAWWSGAEIKSSQGIMPASQETRESGATKMVAGAQTERVHILEPGEERAVVVDQLKTESVEVIDQEALPREEDDHWWKQWAVKAAKIWTGLVVVEHESGAKYYKQQESEINNSPPGERLDLSGRDEAGNQVIERGYPEENKIIFYQDKSKGRSDNEKIIQEALIGEPINSDSNQSGKMEQNEEIYFLLPLQE